VTWWLALPLGAVLAFTAIRLDACAWACHGIARLRGGQWYPDHPRCPGCGYRVHILRVSPVAVAAGNPGGYLCVACSSGRQR
jgi:hypothetical protein